MKLRARWRFLLRPILRTSRARKFTWTAEWAKSKHTSRGGREFGFPLRGLQFVVRLDQKGGRSPPFFIGRLFAVRWIRRVGGVDIEEPGVRGVAGSVAVAVGVVARRAMRSEFHAARRLRVLPERGVRIASSCG